MKTLNHWTRSFGAVVLSLALVAVLAPLKAQGVDIVLVGETAGDDVSLFLAEGGWHGGGLGLQPVVSLQTYVVTHDVDVAGQDGDRTIWSVNPMAGLRYQASGGFVQGKLGYAFKDDDEGDDDVTPFFGGAEDGVTASGHAEWWGDGPFDAQGIVAHNFGADYLWSRLRGTLRLIDSPSGDFHAGLEGGWQGEISPDEIVDGVTRPTYRAFMLGPLVKWSSTNVIGVIGGGWKDVDTDVNDGVTPDDDESTWYARVELVLMPRW